MGAPTAEELDLIATFKERVGDLLEKDYQKEDIYIVGWLRARDHDLDRAEELFRNSMEWRKENNIDALMDLTIDQIYFEKFSRILECHTKDGHPVISVPFGEWDIPFTSASEENIQSFRDYTMQGCEQLMDEVRKANKARKNPETDPPISQCVLLIDMAGFSFMNLLNVTAVQKGLELLGFYEANYPESLHSAYLINSSSMINMLLSLVKPVLATKTYEKIKVFGPNVQDWQPALLEIIDEDQLPPRYGGTKEPALEVDEAEEVEEATEALLNLNVSDDDDDFHEAKEDLDTLD